MHVPDEFRQYLHCLLTFRSEQHFVVGETTSRKARTIFYRPQLLSAYKFDNPGGHLGQYLSLDDIDLDLEQLVLRTERCDELESSDGSFLFSTVPMLVNPKANVRGEADPPFLYLRRDRFLSIKNYLAAYIAKVVAQAKLAGDDGVDHLKQRLVELRMAIRRRIAQYEFKLYPPSVILNGTDMNQYYHLFCPQWKRKQLIEQVDSLISELSSTKDNQTALDVVESFGRKVIPEKKLQWLQFATSNPDTFLRLNELS